MHRDDIFATAAELNVAQTQKDVLRLVHGVAKQHGFDYFIVSGLPPRGVNVLPFVLAEEWPTEWHSRYFSMDYTQFDPVARHCFHTVAPFFWGEAPFDGDDDAAVRVMREAEECGLKAGFCVPVHTEDGSQGCVSFAGSDTDLDTEDRLGLHLISVYAHGRLRGLNRPYNLEKAPRLTDREVEVLKWVSHGKTSSDIGELLGITERTVTHHLQQASHKLGTLNRVHTVAEAMRYHLLPL